MAEVPFGGNHALECPSMSQHATVLKLESFLAQQHWSSIAPVVRQVLAALELVASFHLRGQKSLHLYVMSLSDLVLYAVFVAQSILALKI